MIATVVGLLSLALGLASSTDSPKVVIIGAGISGIGAAVDLLNHNFTDFVILEASPTYGGRIRTVRDGESFLEYGAEWIMGNDGNAVYDLANTEDIVGGDIEENSVFAFTSTGEQISHQQMLKYWKDYEKILNTISSRPESVAEIFRQEVLSAGYDNKTDTFLAVCKIFFESITPVTRWQNEVGAGFGSYQMLNGSSAISVLGGMDQVLDKLMVSKVSGRVTKLV